MTDNSLPNALKHGAFSEILILPGEDPQDFEKLKNELFAEYKPSGVSEERVMLAIARAFWQERRLVLFQYVQHARARKTTVDSDGGYGLSKSLHDFQVKIGLTTEPFVPPAVRPTTAEERANEALLELGRLLTLDHFERELDVESKLQSKIDRLFKRFFQMKAMKQIAGLARIPGTLVEWRDTSAAISCRGPNKTIGGITRNNTHWLHTLQNDRPGKLQEEFDDQITCHPPGGRPSVRLRKRQRLRNSSSVCGENKSGRSIPAIGRMPQAWSTAAQLKREQRFEPCSYFVKHANRSFAYKTRSSLLP